MEKILTPKTTPDMEAFFSKVMERGMGVPLVLDAAPAVTDLEPNSWAIYGNDVYIRTSDGSGIKLTGASF